MPHRKRMRYYSAVRPAIPHSSVGCSRVTHPFAGCPLLGPLDLHVLSTPPAFVLSQDQTLQEILIISSHVRTAVSRCRVDSVSESLNCTGIELCSTAPVDRELKRVRLAHSDSTLDCQTALFWCPPPFRWQPLILLDPAIVRKAC